MDEKNNVTKSHKLLLANRKNGAFSGVVDVLSFDVAEILLETELGMLLIKGHDLHVNRLCALVLQRSHLLLRKCPAEMHTHLLPLYFGTICPVNTSGPLSAVSIDICPVCQQ